MPPFLAALMFATHPIHTEVVTWVGGLPDVTFTFLCLLSLYLFIRSDEQDLVPRFPLFERLRNGDARKEVAPRATTSDGD